MERAALDWTEKYRPKTLSEIAGNKKAIQKLVEWAKLWQAGKPKKKGMLIYGRPGTGKTSAAYALAHDMGWDYIELNASDQRNSDVIKRVVGGASTSVSLFQPSGSKRTLIIMDEIDNINPMEDRGGMAALLTILKRARQPILMIANDFWQGVVPKLKGRLNELKENCELVEFRPVSIREAKAYLIKILKNEGIFVEEKALDEILRRNIVEGHAVDLRGAIMDLQAVCLGKKRVTLQDLGVLSWRDRELNIFQTLGTIFSTNSYKKAWIASMRVDLAPDDLLSWLAENVPKVYKDPEELYRAYDALSKADVYLGRVIKTGSYSFWSYATQLMTAGVALAKKGEKKLGWVGYSSSSWLKFYMKHYQQVKTIREAARKVRHILHLGWREFIREYLPFLREYGKRNPETIASLAFHAGLTREEIAAILGVSPEDKLIKDIMEIKREISKKYYEEAMRASKEKKEEIKQPQGETSEGKEEKKVKEKKKGKKKEEGTLESQPLF